MSRVGVVHPPCGSGMAGIYEDRNIGTMIPCSHYSGWGVHQRSWNPCAMSIPKPFMIGACSPRFAIPHNNLDTRKGAHDNQVGFQGVPC